MASEARVRSREGESWSVRHVVVSACLAHLAVAGLVLTLVWEQFDPLVLALSIVGAVGLLVVWVMGISYLGGVADGRFLEKHGVSMPWRGAQSDRTEGDGPT